MGLHQTVRHFLNASGLWFIVDNFFLCRVRIIRKEGWNYEKLAANLGQLLTKVPVEVIRKYERRCLRLIDIYDKGATGRFAAFINKKYTSHRRVPAALENGVLTQEWQADKTIYEKKIGKWAETFVEEDVEDESGEGDAEDEEEEAGSGPENDYNPEFDDEMANVEDQEEVSSGSDGEAEYIPEDLPPRSRQPSTRLNNDFVLESAGWDSSDED